MARKHAKEPSEVIAEIARQTLGIETLEQRKADSLDFHELSVWSIRQALQQAYEAGLKAGQPEATTPPWVRPIQCEPNAKRRWRVARVSRAGRLYALIVRANSKDAAIRATEGKGTFVDIVEINEAGTVIG